MGSTRAAIYARQSLDRTGEGAAVERQIADCLKLAKARGWTVEPDKILTDNDLSASTGKSRPGYEQLLRLIRSRRVDVVIVWAVDRLTRRVIDLEEIISAVESSGVKIATVTGDLDLSSDIGQMVARFLATVAQGEVKRKGARQRRANEQRRDNGHMGWTRRPFAYDRNDDGAIVVVEEEAAALRAAAAIVLDPDPRKSTLARAVRMLNERGLATTGRRVLRDDDGNPLRDEDGQLRHGSYLPWNVTSLRRALLNPRYSGRVTYNGVPVPDVTGQWPVILDAETQDRLVEKLRDVRRRLQQGTDPKYLLSGLAVCGKCGAVMFASPLGPKNRRRMAYRCTKSTHLARGMHDVDQVVEGVVIARLSRPDAAAVLVSTDDLDALRAEAVELRRRRDDLADLLADGLLDRAKVTERAGELTRRIADVEDRIAAALGTSPVAQLVAADDVAAAWAQLDLRSKKAAIEQLMTVTIAPTGKGVRFSPEQVQIAWKGDRS